MNDDRTPPHDRLAERSVLGALLTSRQALADVQDTGLTGRDFYSPTHELVYEACMSLAGRGDPVDVLTVVAELRLAGTLTRVGGPVAVSELVGELVTAANAGYYARSVASLAVLRRLADAGVRITQLAHVGVDGHGGGSAEDAATAAWTELQQATTGAGGIQVRTFADVAEAAFDAIGRHRHTPTPWSTLNHLIGGWSPTYLYGLGARPGQGKTVVAAQAAIEIARGGPGHDPLGAAYYTFEMSGERLYHRALAYESAVDGAKLRTGDLSDAEWRALAKADEHLKGLPFVVQDSAGWTMAQVRAHARAAHRRRPLGLVVVDHVGRVKASVGGRAQSREQQVAENAHVLLDLAHELDCAVLMVTQLNRQPTQRADPRPVAADVRESDVIEQNCDVLMLMHRDVEKAPDDLVVLVAKNRDGVLAPVTLEFRGGQSRVKDRPWRPSDASATAS